MKNGVVKHNHRLSCLNLRDRVYLLQTDIGETFNRTNKTISLSNCRKTKLALVMASAEIIIEERRRLKISNVIEQSI